MMNDVAIMTDDGKFTSDFKPEMLGDEYKDSKFLETTPDLVSLMKAGIDTKSALGKKLENVIQKPGENATEQELADYNKALKEARGAPDSVEAYDWKPPDGQTHDENLVKLFKEVFLEIGLPPSDAEVLVGKWDAYQAQVVAQMQAAQKAADDAEDAAWTTAHPGDSAVTDGRTAVKALLMYAGEDFAKEVKEAKLIDDPGNLAKWRKLGISPASIDFYTKIGKDMKADTAITNEGDPTNTTETKHKAGERTKEELIPKVYTHPTSVADRKARGKAE
jgi:hypothetical protein